MESVGFKGVINVFTVVPSAPRTGIDKDTAQGDEGERLRWYQSHEGISALPLKGAQLWLSRASDVNRGGLYTQI